jgi:antitoxin VapB
MGQENVAKLFRNGASQAVRLPAEYRFEGTEVFISRDAETGDVILSTRPGARAWSEFFQHLRSMEDTPEFMSDRPMNRLPVERDIFAVDDENDEGNQAQGQLQPGRR